MSVALAVSLITRNKSSQVSKKHFQTVVPQIRCVPGFLRALNVSSSGEASPPPPQDVEETDMTEDQMQLQTLLYEATDVQEDIIAILFCLAHNTRHRNNLNNRPFLIFTL